MFKIIVLKISIGGRTCWTLKYMIKVTIVSKEYVGIGQTHTVKVFLGNEHG